MCGWCMCCTTEICVWCRTQCPDRRDLLIRDTPRATLGPPGPRGSRRVHVCSCVSMWFFVCFQSQFAHRFHGEFVLLVDGVFRSSLDILCSPCVVAGSKLSLPVGLQLRSSHLIAFSKAGEHGMLARVEF